MTKNNENRQRKKCEQRQWGLKVDNNISTWCWYGLHSAKKEMAPEGSVLVWQGWRSQPRGWRQMQPWSKSKRGERQKDTGGDRWGARETLRHHMWRWFFRSHNQKWPPVGHLQVITRQVYTDIRLLCTVAIVFFVLVKQNLLSRA